MPYKDPEKQKAYQQKWSAENKRPKRKQTSWLKRKQMVEDAKNKPCEICNTSYNSVAMDLHHRDPSIKDATVAKLMKSCSYSLLQEEIDKCAVLCSNCHRLLHAGLVNLP